MEEQQRETNPSKKYLIIIIVTVALLIIGIIFMVLRQNQTTKTTTNTNSNAATNTNTADTNTANVNTNTGTSILDPIAKARDVSRVNDIRTIMTALESYKTSNGQYPEKLEDLVQDGELGSVPNNPEPNGESYSYTPIGTAPYQAFDLCYALETNGVESIEAGRHCATANDITGFM